jgi:hypothetical protein
MQPKCRVHDVHLRAGELGPLGELGTREPRWLAEAKKEKLMEEVPIPWMIVIPVIVLLVLVVGFVWSRAKR